MSRRLAVHVCMLLTVALVVSGQPLLGAKPEAPGSRAAVQQIRPDETQASELRGKQRISLETGAPLALYRVGYQVDRGTPKSMAAQYMRENAALLRLGSADLSDLAHRFTWSGPAGTTVRFQQHVDGIPVYGAEVAVTIDNTASVVFVMNAYKQYAAIGITTPAILADEARRSALDYLDVQGSLSFERTRLVVYHNRGPSRLAWEVRLEPQISPVGDWEVLVDARSGEIFKVVDKALYVDGSGNVFDPDPLSSAGATYGDTGFTDGSDADTTQLTGELMIRPLRDITLNGSTYSLAGPWAEIDDFESPLKGSFSQTSSSFAFTRNQDGFEAVNTYYHIDTVMRYINVTLGLSITPYQYSGGVRYDPHGLNGGDNSHYLTGSGRVSFGEGGVDDAEDADVVVHELGHGLHDWVTGGGLSQVNGLSEGIGDFVAGSYSRALGQWTPADPQYHWVFSWDGHNPFWGGRITNYGAKYPGGLTGQIHTDGQIWSTCMMRVWDALGRELTEKAHWSGIAMTNSISNQEDAAQAVLTAAVNLGYSPADVATMQSILQGCGYDVSAPCTSTCGNDLIECTETCDGTDLGGRTCGDEACTGGILACNGTCDGFDTSGCTGCSTCDNDGVCEAGEDCNGCPNDCVGGTTTGAFCGNGICEAGNGEDCLSCPTDCNGKQNGKPANRYCCGDGATGDGPVDCSDSRCTSGGVTCTNDPVIPGSYCCGDMVCDSGESCASCALDCTSGAEICTGGVDEDCNGAIDCADSVCSDDPACQTTCAGDTEPCLEDIDCCSGVCTRGKPANRVCVGGP